MLKNFIGYGSFLTEGMNKGWDMDDLNVNAQPKSSNTVFAACNGIYIDVFKVKLGHKWRHTHSIRLTDLTPTISRRITCQMMIDTITSNAFMWLEDSGVCCTIWDLQKGSNISYVSIPDDAKLRSPVFRGSSTMSISPDESMVAVASIDGILTTFHANTGIAISSRKFSGQQIEYVAFNGRNNQLFMIIRNNTTELRSFILDPLQLNSSIRANQVPVPAIGRTILAFFSDESSRNKGLVCKANGSEIQCYVSHAVVDSKVSVDSIKYASPTETLYTPLRDEQAVATKNANRAEAKHAPKTVRKGGRKAEYKDDEPKKAYKVSTTASMEMRDDDYSLYWVLRVEVVERDLDHFNEEVIFSFVPEPWMRISASKKAITAASTSVHKTVAAASASIQKPGAAASTSMQKTGTASTPIFKRLSTAASDFQPPQLMFLKALECDTSTDQESPEESRSSHIQSTGEFGDRVKDFFDFLDMQNERLLAQKDKSTSSDEIFTVLTLLLYEDDLKDDNHVFLEGLFTTIGNGWIPHPSAALNPIKRVIEIRNEQLLAIMIDYCINNARKHHPAYLEPVEQCLSDILGQYPDIASDLFRKASYIPARNHEYVASHAADSSHISMAFGNIFNSKTQSIENTDGSDNRVFTLRTQLPTTDNFGRETRFPQGKNKDQQPVVIHHPYDIYVSPFQFKPFQVGGRKESLLDCISARDLTSSPAVIASLRYKWYKYGRYFWAMRFVVVLIFFILVVIITAQQIRVSKVSNGQVPSADEIAARYLPGWRPIFMITIAIGFILLGYEMLQMSYSLKKYFRSPFNYVDLASCLFPVIGCFVFLRITPGTQEDIGIDGGPSQIWVMGFGILLLYLNMLFELRIISQLGDVVNIIFNITRRIKWFFVVFFLFLVSFTHGFLYMLHTRRYRPCEGDSCKHLDYPSGYPTGFFEAFLATYFFMSGRYDPVETSLEKGSVSFRVMMVIFFFFTVILLLNVLIALVNDAFSESVEKSGSTYWKLVADVIAEVETQSIFNLLLRSYNRPGLEYTYYCATEEEVRKFQSKVTSIVAQSSTEMHNETHQAQRMIIKGMSEVKESNNNAKEELKKFVEETMQKEFGELRAFMQQLSNQ
ncbi:MAG: hypothetical protein J3Q66DRAFT_383968 [Benniella sp.]|nr:MAG: hypothetical protein J3Q66DRAFT_383968 [Benniella sp.]